MIRIIDTVNRSRWSRAAVLAVLAVLCLFPLTGCQPRPGVAAFVGGTRITEDQVRALAQAGLKDRSVRDAIGADVSTYHQLLLGRLIKYALVDGAAGRLGVRVSDGQVDQAISSQAQRLGGRRQLEQALAQAPYRLPPGQVRPFVRDIVLLGQMGERLTRGVSFSDAELKSFYDQNGGASTGQTFEQLKPRVVEVLRQQRGGEQAQRYVGTYLRQVGLKVNPRYGRFDRTKLFDQNEPSLLVSSPGGLVRESASH